MESVKRTLKTVSIKLTFKVDELFRDVFFSYMQKFKLCLHG